ncbi:MAG: hypothetical protein R3C61_25460 [Bacteroidia bacterium]
MDQLKTYIQSLPILEQIALSAWLAKLIQDEVEKQAEGGILFLDTDDSETPPTWMWEKAESLYKKFNHSGEEGLSWQEVKRLSKNKGID